MYQNPGLFQNLKKFLYFPIAHYFRFFASIKLRRWNPEIIVITGSNGKTSLMNLLVSQLKDRAAYSHHANSSYGIPFNILGLERKNLLLYEWIFLFIRAPLQVFSKTSNKKLYVVEADCDRPGEGVFLSSLLKPDVTIWFSSSRSHSMNFDGLVSEGKFSSVEDAIAYEYGYFLEATGKLAIINSDSELIKKQSLRTPAKIKEVSKKDLEKYEISEKGTVFKIKGKTYKFNFLLPEAFFSSIYAALYLTEYLDQPFDDSFASFDIPPGRSSLINGVRNVRIVDSCYNSNLSSATEIINMFNMIDSQKKWAVIGDMLEQGNEEREEHEKLADLIVKSRYDRVILLGPRILRYGLPILKKYYGENAVGYTSPKDVLSYLNDNLKGKELVLFKGARFLEGVIENLLADKTDASKLSRREKIWEVRRKKWGL